MPPMSSGDAVLLTFPSVLLRDLLSEVAVIEEVDCLALPESKGRRVRVMLTSGVQSIGATELDRLPNLGLIVTLGAGYDGIDMNEAKARGILLATSSGINADAVADATVGLFLAAARGIVANDARVREGRWRPGELRPVRSIGALRVGIVGMGAIGRAITSRLLPFRCRLSWTGPNPKPDIDLTYEPELIALARQSDALIVAAPLTPETRGMIDDRVIDALGPSGLLVNVGRGPLVDEDALIDALRDGRLGGAALDVFLEEPTPPKRWHDVPNVVLSPHTAGVTQESMAVIMSTAAQRAVQFAKYSCL